MEFYSKMPKDSNCNLVKNPKMKVKKNILRQKKFFFKLYIHIKENTKRFILKENDLVISQKCMKKQRSTKL